ncbi:MAG: hypothetical protein IPN01_25095 [Deltaproteobacteria bacterium]|nr:hypothetical protein [Deltaproteobacteria bacterium]
MERIETLTGKYGDEGDKLIFRILKRGEGSDRGEADLALRYDLTVPGVVAMNHDLVLPFKRYQIQPVWRADRPQQAVVSASFTSVTAASSAQDMRPADAECRRGARVPPGLGVHRLHHPALNHRAILRAIVTAAGCPSGRARCSWPWTSSTRSAATA